MNISTVMESSIDGRPTVENLLQSQNISDASGDLSQREEPVIIHIQGSPQPPSASQASRGPGIGKVLVDFLPVNYFLCHVLWCGVWTVECQHLTESYHINMRDIMVVSDC